MEIEEGLKDRVVCRTGLDEKGGWFTGVLGVGVVFSHWMVLCLDMIYPFMTYFKIPLL